MRNPVSLFRRLATVGAVSSLSLAAFALPASAAGLPTLSGSWGTVIVPQQLLLPDRVGSFTVDANGNIYAVPCSQGVDNGYVSCVTSQTVTGIAEYSPSGATVAMYGAGTAFTNVRKLVTDGAGNVYAWLGNNLYDATAAGATLMTLPNTGGWSIQDMTVTTTGVLEVLFGSGSNWTLEAWNGASWSSIGAGSGVYAYYLANGPGNTPYLYYYPSGSGTPNIGTISPTGSLTAVMTAVDPFAESLAVDGAGNAYLADENNVVQITPEGVSSYLPVDPSTASYGSSTPDEVVIAGSSLYLFDEEPYQNVGTDAGSNGFVPFYTWGVTPIGVTHATNLFATASTAHVGATVTQTVTATWTGGAPSYRCTLLYGYNNPSTFTVTTTSPTCTFTNLTLGVAWGVSVVALNNDVASAPSVTFAAPASFTITCTYRGHVLHRTGTDPRCPLRWVQHVA